MLRFGHEASVNRASIGDLCSQRRRETACVTLVQGEVALPEKVDLSWHILHEMLFSK